MITFLEAAEVISERGITDFLMDVARAVVGAGVDAASATANAVNYLQDGGLKDIADAIGLTEESSKASSKEAQEEGIVWTIAGPQTVKPE